MSDTKEREQLIGDLRTIARRDLAFAPQHIPGHYASIAADLIESQAAQLAAAETRVVVLTDALKNASYALFQIKRMGGVTDAIKEFVIAENDKANAVLDSTDTAAQTLRPKYIETTSCGRCEYEEADGSLIEQCPKCKAIDAAKEKS